MRCSYPVGEGLLCVVRIAELQDRGGYARDEGDREHDIATGRQCGDRLPDGSDEDSSVSTIIRRRTVTTPDGGNGEK